MKIQIQTAQNVTVEYEIAGIGRRIAAALIDFLIVIGYILSLVLISSMVRSLNIPGFLLIIFIIPAFFYDLLCEMFMDGQSFGKKSMNIKVVKLDGSQPAFINYFLRWILRIVDVMFSYGVVAIVTILVNGKGQRLGDLAANTTVIRLRQDATLDDTILTELEEGYQVVFPQAAALTDKDAGLIKEVIDRINEMHTDYNSDMLLSKTKDAISKKLGIATEMDPYSFLITVLKDYNHHHDQEL